MKQLVVSVLALLLTCSLQAKSLREMWVSMPDSILPTMNSNIRTEFMELLDMNVKAEVRNLLSTDCVMDTVTSNYLRLSMSKVSTLEMRTLPMENGDTILCMVKTYQGPEKESELHFYDANWQVLDNGRFFLNGVLADVCQKMVVKPDTMSEQHYQELVSLVEPKMWSAALSVDDDNLTFSLSLPLVSLEEKKRLQAILVQRKFKWEYGMFKEI